MVPHLGHLVQRPSGISRFLDFVVPSFGFLGKVVSAGVGGAAIAGSGASNPRVFLVKEVVAMNQSKVDRWSAARRWAGEASSLRSGSRIGPRLIMSNP